VTRCPACSGRHPVSGCRARRAESAAGIRRLLVPVDEVPNADADASSTVAALTGVESATAADPDVTTSMPWMPDFDITDDLGGALNADSPLLARAFRGIERHDS
jgi:hypothetical protein